MPPSRSARCKVVLLAASMAAILLFSTCTPFLDEEGYIKALNPTLSLSATSLSLYPSGTATLTATLSPATSESISWSSSSTSVATVDSNGKVTAYAKGTATITATSFISGKTASCAVTVSTHAVTLSSSTLQLYTGGTATLTATITPSVSGSVTWSSSNYSIVTVDSSGLVTALQMGSATITASYSDGSAASCVVTVSAHTVTLSSSTLQLYASATATLTATITPTVSGSVSWGSSANYIATVNSNGLVTALQPGSATITATYSDGSASSCTVTVSAHKVTLSSPTLQLYASMTAALTATITPTASGSVSWSSSDTSIATVSSNGLVVAKKAGSANITATYSDGGTASCAVTVLTYATVSTLAGSSSWGYTNGTGTTATFWYPHSVAIDSSGYVYVADTNNEEIRKISPLGVVSTLAGSGSYGSVDGTGTAASFYQPCGVAVDSSGNVYVADTYNNKIRKISPSGVVSTLAGSGYYNYADNTDTLASFDLPYGVCVDAATPAVIYVADTDNYRIRKITQAN